MSEIALHVADKIGFTHRKLWQINNSGVFYEKPIVVFFLSTFLFKTSTKYSVFLPPVGCI
jgi:hypothetical protein